MRVAIYLSLLGFGLLTMPSAGHALTSDHYRLGSLATHYQVPEELSTVTDDVSSEAGSTWVPLDLSLASPQYNLDNNPYAEASSDAMAGPLPNDATTANLDLNVPTIRTPKIERHVQFFSYHIRDRFEQWLSRLERYRPTVQNIFSEFNLPMDLVFLSLVESGFNTNAVSRAKAVGPWQFMKQTARNYGLRVDSWVDERRDPVKSSIAAAQYLRDLYHMFGSWPLAMAAYNAGEGRVGRSLARVEDGDFWVLTDKKLLKAETREYVPRFVAAVQIAKDPGRFGFNIAPQAPVEYEEVAITRPVHLKAAAKAAGVSFEEMKALNPELRRDMTPPDPLYILKVPVGTKAEMVANLATYQALYPAVYHEPKKSLFRGHTKDKPVVAHSSQQRRKSQDWLAKGKPGKGKSQVLAKVSR
jgi:hypothetical protein